MLKKGCGEMRLFNSAVAVVVCAMASFAEAGTTLRVVTYNVNADTTSYDVDSQGNQTGTPNAAAMTTALQAIGNHALAGNAQPIDVLALQELYATPSVTLQSIVGDLNSVYGAGTYAYDPYVYSQPGLDLTAIGNGPSGLIYNTKTVQVVSVKPVGATSTNGAAREPLRYELQPVGGAAGTQFYMYVDHYKADSGSTNQARRNVEAQQVRADADSLGPDAHIIYAGDFNLTSGSSENAYQTLIAAGNGQAHDTVNPANNFTQGSSSAYKEFFSESDDDLTARFDFQLVSAAAINQPGLELVPDTLSAFGTTIWTGATPSTTLGYHGDVTDAGNGALADLSNRSAVFSALDAITDHLPVVADYADNVPEPTMLGLAGIFVLALQRKRSSAANKKPATESRACE